MASRHFLQRCIVLRPGFLTTYRSGIHQSLVRPSQHLLGSGEKTKHGVLCQTNASLHTSRSLLEYTGSFNIQDKEDFNKRVMSSDSVVIVDFHADWCNPCKALAPVLEAAMKKTQGQLKLAKVDIDELQDLAIRFRVNSVPTVMAFKDGKAVDHFIGLQSQEKIEMFLEKQMR